MPQVVDIDLVTNLQHGEIAVNIQSYAEYMRLQGHRIVSTGACFWHEYRPFFYVAIPIFLVHDVPANEVRSMLSRRAWAGLMYSCAHGGNGNTNHYAITDPAYGLYSLSKKARNQTKQGLQKCKIAMIGWDRLEQEGIEINRDALHRQGRRTWNLTLTMPNLWRNRMSASQKFPDVNAWGAFVDDRLVSYAITALVDDDAIILSTMSRTQYLDSRPNNALIFTIAQAMFNQGAKKVSYGVVSKEPELGHFKESMGFQQFSIPHRLVLNPLLIPIVSRLEKYQRLHIADKK